MEETDRPQHVADLEQRLTGIETDTGNEAGTQEIIGGHGTAACTPSSAKLSKTMPASSRLPMMKAKKPT